MGGGNMDVPEPGFEESTVVARQLMRTGPPFPQWLDQDLKNNSKTRKSRKVKKGDLGFSPVRGLIT